MQAIAVSNTVYGPNPCLEPAKTVSDTGFGPKLYLEPRVYGGFPDGFHRGSIGFPVGFSRRVPKGFPVDLAAGIFSQKKHKSNFSLKIRTSTNKGQYAMLAVSQKYIIETIDNKRISETSVQQRSSLFSIHMVVIIHQM